MSGAALTRFQATAKIGIQSNFLFIGTGIGDDSGLRNPDTTARPAYNTWKVTIPGRYG